MTNELVPYVNAGVVAKIDERLDKLLASLDGKIEKAPLLQTVKALDILWRIRNEMAEMGRPEMETETVITWRFEYDGQVQARPPWAQKRDAIYEGDDVVIDAPSAD